MAEWYKKYYYSFRDIEDGKYTVEIWEDVPNPPAPAPVEIRGAQNPCVINYTNDYLYNPVWGSGAELSLLSTSDRMFLGLYTDNMMKYQVRVYKTVWITPSYSVEMPVWFGYLDSENYSEDFSHISNYPVDITANDGFNLLSRMYYMNTATNPSERFVGIRTQWNGILNILRKLNLPWEYIYVGISTTPLDSTLNPYQTIFHYTFMNNDNWYNEDDEPETCRTVLENILKPYGAFIIQKDGNIYITDINHIAQPSASFKKFEYDSSPYSELNYLTTQTINLLLGDISSIGIQSNNIQFSIESGINKQVVSYNPYAQSIIFNSESKEDLEGKAVISETTYGSYSYSWKESILEESNHWTSFNDAKFCKMEGATGANEGVKDYYLKIPNRGLIGSLTESPTSYSFTYKLNLPILIPSNNYFLKIEMQVYFRTLQDLNNPDEVMPKGISRGELCCRLQVGTKKFVFDPKQWVDVNDSKSLVLHFVELDNPYTFYPINDEWKNLSTTKLFYLGNGIPGNWTKETKPYLVPINAEMLTGGQIYFDIYGYKAYEMPVFPINVESTVEDLRIKDVKLTVVDSNGNEVGKSDIEYISKLNSNYTNEGQKVTTYQGTNISQHPVQRGNLLAYANNAYTYIPAYNKEGDTNIPEKLLLRSIKSNYGDANVKLKIELPANNNLGYFTYVNYLPNKKLFPISNKINLEENTSQMELREIHKDEAIIV